MDGSLSDLGSIYAGEVNSAAHLAVKSSLGHLAAEIAIVGQQRVGMAKPFRQGINLREHRRNLLLVVGRLNHLGGDHQKTLRRHHRLRIVAGQLCSPRDTRPPAPKRSPAD